MVSLTTGAIVHFEALARWHHPRLGWVPPMKFIPLAEAAGLINDIGRFVLDSSCAHLAAWRAAGVAHDVSVAVNVSAREVQQATFVDTVLATVAAHGLAAGDVIIEITESVEVHENGGGLEELARLRDAGIRLAMDDFGTGYASLSALRLLPVEMLKIDRSFVNDLDADAHDHVFTRAIAELGQALGLAVVAEGIETLDQLRATRSLGCDIGQGYYFSRPVRGDAVPELLDRDFADAVEAVAVPVARVA